PATSASIEDNGRFHVGTAIRREHRARLSPTAYAAELNSTFNHERRGKMYAAATPSEGSTSPAGGSSASPMTTLNSAHVNDSTWRPTRRSTESASVHKVVIATSTNAGVSCVGSAATLTMARVRAHAAGIQITRTRACTRSGAGRAAH